MPVVVRGSVSVALGAAAFGLAALFADVPAHAQESAATYPSRSITFLVGFAAGGPTDVIARGVAVPLPEELGQPVVVENTPGGGDGKSEPEHFVDFADRAPDWRVLVCLVGHGQEIHIGEEAGLIQWRHAIERSSRRTEWHVHGPSSLAGDAFEQFAVAFEHFGGGTLQSLNLQKDFAPVFLERIQAPAL